MCNVARQILFTQGKRTFNNIPPTASALQQHTLRSTYQSMVWWRCLDPIQRLPDLGLWGWSMVDNEWRTDWSKLPEASKDCIVLINCGCHVSCRGQCSINIIVDVVNILLRRKSNILQWMIYFDSFWLGHTYNRNAYLSLGIIMPFL